MREVRVRSFRFQEKGMFLSPALCLMSIMFPTLAISSAVSISHFLFVCLYCFVAEHAWISLGR